MKVVSKSVGPRQREEAGPPSPFLLSDSAVAERRRQIRRLMKPGVKHAPEPQRCTGSRYLAAFLSRVSTSPRVCRAYCHQCRNGAVRRVSCSPCGQTGV